MIFNRRFLLVILLCWPFVSVADDAEYNVNTLTEAIQSSQTIDEAITNLRNAFATSNDYHNPSGQVSNEQEKKVEKAIEVAKSCKTSESDHATESSVATPGAGQNSGDGRSEEEKKQALEDAQNNYEEAKETEQSTANKTLTALTTAATGIGGMELAMGLSQQQADKEADENMAAYIATMRCSYADGKQVKAGPDEIELPGGNDSELMKLRTEYFALAADLKERKTALGMKPGIESEEIIDKSQTGLYDDENLGIDSGAYASLYRAQMLGSETDQTKIDEERNSSKNRVIAGGVLAGAGVIGGVVGNTLINGKLGERLKQAIAEKKVGKETQALLKKETKALEDLRSCLKSAGISETEKLSFSNFYPSILSVKSINCKKDLLPVSGNKLSSGDAPNTIKASDMFADSTDETEIYNKILTYINIETVSKLVGYSFSSTANLNTEQTNIKNKIKTSIESIQQKFDAAAEKDKEAANKAGISLGNITSKGDGLFDKSSLFSNVSSLDSDNSFLSQFMSKE